VTWLVQFPIKHDHVVWLITLTQTSGAFHQSR